MPEEAHESGVLQGTHPPLDQVEQMTSPSTSVDVRRAGGMHGTEQCGI